MTHNEILRGDYVAYTPINLINQERPIIGRVQAVTVDEQLILATPTEYIIADPAYCRKISHDFANAVKVTKQE